MYVCISDILTLQVYHQSVITQNRPNRHLRAKALDFFKFIPVCSALLVLNNPSAASSMVFSDNLQIYKNTLVHFYSS